MKEILQKLLNHEVLTRQEMKNILAQIREMPDGFPFETTIKTETFGKGRTKYVFT